MKKILAAIHELSFTGSTVSAKNMCLIFLKNNYDIEVWSYEDGPYRAEFEELGIPIRIVNRNSLSNKDILKKIKKFNLLIANTICTHEIVKAARYLVPTVWYIHEAENLPDYFWGQQERYNTFISADNILVVSEYAQDYITAKYGKQVKVIHNYVNDYYQTVSNEAKSEDNNVVRFLMLGAVLERKAFDIFFHAFMTLTQDYQDKCELHFAGSLPAQGYQYSDQLMKEVSHYDNIYYHGEIQDTVEVMKLIDKCDVVVVPSRDESCSLVSLEGAMMGKPLVLSRNVGAKYLLNGKNGWLIETGSIDSLRSMFQEIIDNPEPLQDMGAVSRKRYLETSTKELYEVKLLEIIEEYLSESLWRFRFYKFPERIRSKFDKIVVSPLPYPEIKSQDKIILYGAGKSGIRCFEAIKASKFCRIVLWVDRNYNEIKKDGFPVSNPEELKNYKFDFVIITVMNKSTANEIYNWLIKVGVSDSKIKLLYKTT